MTLYVNLGRAPTGSGYVLEAYREATPAEVLADPAVVARLATLEADLARARDRLEAVQVELQSAPTDREGKVICSTVRDRALSLIHASDDVLYEERRKLGLTTPAADRAAGKGTT